MTNDQRGQTTFDQERGKQLAGQVDEWQQARAKGAQTMTAFANFERANKQFTTGAAAGARLAVGKWAQMAGIPDSVLASGGLDKNAIASAEEMRALTSRMMVDLIGKGGFPAQNFSNADREELMRSLSSVDNTPEGNARIIAIGRAAAQRQIDIGQAWGEWRRTNGTTPQSVERFMEERLPQIIEKDVIAPLADSPASGGQRQIPPEAVQMLRSGRGTPEQFDAQFGPGSAARVMGRQ
jgi:hypothetical protein